jgi:hypothetical protein
VGEADWPGGTAMVRTPLENLEGVASVRVGSARWDPNNKRENWNR